MRAGIRPFHELKSFSHYGINATVAQARLSNRHGDNDLRLNNNNLYLLLYLFLLE